MGMWKATKWLLGATATMVALYFASLQIPDKLPPNISLIIFILACIFATLFIFTGIVSAYLFVKKHLYPIRFIEDVKCTYWTKEKQMQVSYLFCDYSESNTFTVNCMAIFNEQVVNIDRCSHLNMLGDQEAKCINGK